MRTLPLLYIPLLCGVLLTSACTEVRPSDPMCRVLDSAYENHQGTAACVVRVNDLLLTLNHNDKLALPQASPLNDESAQCTAHRAIWQSTGFNVEVGQRLATDQNNIAYYQCELSGQFDGELIQFSVPRWSPVDIEEILFSDPFELQPHQWHDHEQLIFVRHLFNQVENKPE